MFHRTITRLGLVVALAATLVGPIAAAPAAAVVDRRVPSLPPRVLRAATTADGERVRTTPHAVVDLVRLSEGLRTRFAVARAPLYRVTVFGSYPARALRYVLLADGAPMGYAVPRADQRAVIATTTDDAVLTAGLKIRYGSRLCCHGRSWRPCVPCQATTRAVIGSCSAEAKSD